MKKGTINSEEEVNLTALVRGIIDNEITLSEAIKSLRQHPIEVRNRFHDIYLEQFPLEEYVNVPVTIEVRDLLDSLKQNECDTRSMVVNRLLGNKVEVVEKPKKKELIFGIKKDTKSFSVTDCENLAKRVFNGEVTLEESTIILSEHEKMIKFFEITLKRMKLKPTDIVDIRMLIDTRRMLEEICRAKKDTIDNVLKQLIHGDKCVCVLKI